MATKKIKTVVTPKAGDTTKAEVTTKKPVASRKTVKTSAKAEKALTNDREKVIDSSNAIQTAKKLEKKITEKKDLKYLYSPDDDTLAKRKKFRTKVRAELKKIEKLLAKLKSSELPEDLELYAAEYKKLEKLRSRYYTKEYLATID